MFEHFSTIEELKSRFQGDEWNDDFWKGSGYYQILGDIFQKYVQTPEQRLKEIEGTRENLSKEVILLKSYLVEGNDLQIFWDVGDCHCPLTELDADVTTRLTKNGEKLHGFYKTVSDLMLSGF